ncbi:MAG TPA: sigma 54-interacting transcriptional regulator [Polyangiaceae bacterium]
MGRRSTPQPVALVAEALSSVVGAALVLDAELRVVLATSDAETLLGYDVPLGISAPKLLCGESAKRPVAEALAAGRPVQAVIPLPSKGGAERLLKVRSLPIGQNSRRGWLLLLDEAGTHGAEAVLFHGMWAQSVRMKEVFRIVTRVAAEDVTVLVRGETGTGKELVARAIHDLSGRKKGPFRALNCAALPANLLESELFGHVRGAFTGAVRDTPGHVQLAHRGTLFLDEVAELPLELQAKLLRVLETRSVIPVGAREPTAVDVRIVSATHRALRKEVEAGRFRADLMYRLRVIPIFLPALRERREDIGLLCEKLIESMNATSRRRIERVAPAALSVLERHDWPGNVRELRNALAYAYAMGDGPILEPSDLPAELLDPALGSAEAVNVAPSVPEGLDPQARRILQVLERTSGNKNRAAQILGMSRVTLWRRLRELGLDTER